jgi:uncharacterized caspase-like protein
MKLYGVFVGIDEYKDQDIKRLNFAAYDAEQFHRIVAERISDKECKTWLLTNCQATKAKVLDTIGNQLAEKAALDDFVLLYFSGHGSPETSHQVDAISRYLIMYDTLRENIYGTGLDLERDVVRLFERIKSNLILVFIDSCFSGMAGGRTFEGPNLVKASLDFRGPKGSSLQELKLGEGRAMITACKDNEVAREDPKLNHGIFTFHLLRILTDTRSGVSALGIANLYEKLSHSVTEYTNGKQHPILNGRIAAGKIPLFV